MTAPADYIAAGLRILPVNAETKAPTMSGFGAHAPDFCADPAEFEPGETPAILCGPCPAGGDKWLVCLDLDGGLRLQDVERVIGPLPPTLTSHGGAHVFYWIEPGPERDQIMQWTDVFGARRPDDKASGRKAAALDLKWSGGYAIERDDWDEGFSVARIATLPGPAVAGLVAHGRKRSVRGESEFEAPADGSWNHDGLENCGQWDGAAERIARFLETRPTDTAGDGGAGLFSTCCHLRALFRLDSQTMFEALKAIYVPRIPDLWTDEQLWHKIEDSKVGSLRAGLTQGELIPQPVKELLRREHAATHPDFELPEAERPPPEPWITAWDLVSRITQIDYLCKEIGLRNGRPSLWTADAMCGKSTLASALAFAAATGQKLWSRLDVEQCAVCYVTDEDIEGVARVFKRLALHQRIELRDCPNLHLANCYALGVGADQEALKHLLASHRLVVFDTLRSLSKLSGIEENDPRFAQGMYDLAALSQQTNCACVVLHHNNKAGKSNGTAALFGAAGTRLEMSRPEQGTAVQVVGYARDGLQLEPFQVEADLRACAPPKDDPDSPGISFVYRPISQSQARMPGNVHQLVMAIGFWFLQFDRWVSLKEIELAHAARRTDLDEALAWMVREKKLAAKTEGNQRFYNRDPAVAPLF